jgi:hypothetical protein
MVYCGQSFSNQHTKQEEHREVEELAPFLRELDAVLAGILETHLHRQARNKGRDEHAGTNHFGYHQA